MTPERFGELLRRPALLSGQNATELESLIAEYPWCGSLRQLRYRKAIVDGDRESERLWATRAEPFLPHGDRHLRAVRLRAKRPAHAVAHFGFADSSDVDADQLVERGPDTEADVPEPGAAATLMLDVAASLATSDWYLHRHGLIMDDGRPKPAPRETFASYRTWKDRRAATSWSDLLRLADEQPGRKKSRKPKRNKAADAPVVASETLAGLLADQGHIDKAIGMYELLALRYPQKSATFAHRIEALKQQQA